MNAATYLALALPGEAFAFGRSALWAILLLVAGCYLRLEIKAVFAEVAKLIARIRSIKYEPPLKMEIIVVPAEEVEPLAIEKK